MDSDSPGFRYAATQCLAAGHYSKPQQYAVEAITAFVQARLTDGLGKSCEWQSSFDDFLTRARVRHCIPR